MTLSQSDIRLALHDGLDRKVVKSIFSNILISSAVLLVLVLFIFKVNKESYVSTFIYGYMAVVSFSLLNAKYIKDDFCSKKTTGINRDFESLMSSATANPIIIQSKRDNGIADNSVKTGMRESINSVGELEELDNFLSNNDTF